MVDIIAANDLPEALRGHELIDVMVAGANARALRVAPCLDSDTPATLRQAAEAKLVLIGAIQRWVDQGSGAFQQQTAGPFSVTTDTRQRGGFNLWPSEISQLQGICKTGDASAFAIDTAPASCGNHSPICSLAFGATYCSCGADIAGVAIYEQVD